jgi:hypothetical protein
MAWTFRRSFRVAPGIRLNVGKRSAGLSVGPRGAKVRASTRGRRTLSLGRGGLFFRRRV